MNEMYYSPATKKHGQNYIVRADTHWSVCVLRATARSIARKLQQPVIYRIRWKEGVVH